jgi:Zn-dependent protease
MDSLFTIQIGDLIFYFIAFILSLSIHESAHALTSYWFGDDTGRLQGRISLNPMAHIDPIGTILIPLVGFISAAQGLLPPLIGWAKPVETNPLRWRNKDIANISVSAAGPISNFLLALTVFIVMKIMILSGLAIRGYSAPFRLIQPMVDQPDWMLPICTFLSLMLLLNVALAVFNLIPIPPLDGSHVLETLLPENLKEVYNQIRPYSWIILLAMLWLGAFGLIMGPVSNLVYSLL